ncbi:class I SAM-dependent methyltransferase [Geomonas nitrogeniifigens]|uniref:Class I SAM-dependent methyltransferase n=1 Tax=Geomonas diazotrophica TaxID=2843197 RepID=A0ABX8JC46_9BACT|nr:class I SAM-dependent methyltransferase [Geomonas nitrogeniifigens]QWV95945.1 class I SAM-dependent methyltransferase [Geomonas nitrogeniifigens]
MPEKTRRACPLCGAHAERARTLLLAQGAPLLSCACGMMYLEVQQQESDLAEYSDYVGNFCNRHDSLLKAGAYAARSILDGLGSVGSLLEVGIGVGALAQQAKARGIDYWCVEPCKELVQLACDKQLIREEKTLICPIEESRLPRERFDAVVLNMVLEHLLDPVLALKIALLALKPGGMIYLEVPNSRLFTLRAALRRRLGMTAFMSGHINFFTPVTIKECLALAGMQESHTRIVSNFRRGEGEAMVSFYKNAASKLKVIDGILRRFPVDEALGIAAILCCYGRKARR